MPKKFNYLSDLVYGNHILAWLGDDSFENDIYYYDFNNPQQGVVQVTRGVGSGRI